MTLECPPVSGRRHVYDTSKTPVGSCKHAILRYKDPRRRHLSNTYLPIRTACSLDKARAFSDVRPDDAFRRKSPGYLRPPRPRLKRGEGRRSAVCRVQGGILCSVSTSPQVRRPESLARIYLVMCQLHAIATSLCAFATRSFDEKGLTDCAGLGFRA